MPNLQQISVHVVQFLVENLPSYCKNYEVKTHKFSSTASGWSSFCFTYAGSIKDNPYLYIKCVQPISIF